MIRKPIDSQSRKTRVKGSQHDRSPATESSRTNPRPQVRTRSSRTASGPQFDAFALQLRQELDVHGTLEELLADVAIRSAWEVHNGRGSETTLLNALQTLDRLRRRRALVRSSSPVGPAPDSGPAADPDRAARLGLGPIRAAEAVVEVPFEPASDSLDDEPADTAWRDRLTFDPEVSDVSPVVRGTWITVSHVVSLVVDGWSWLDILRAHPELIEDDIRACLAWTVEQEGDFHVEPRQEK